MHAVKFVPGSETAIEGNLAPLGGPFNGADLAGEHFTAETDFCLDWYKDGMRPLLWHHGIGDGPGTAPVGRIISAELKADTGVWMRAQLDASNAYYQSIKELIRQGKLGLSSGAMAHLVDVDAKTGRIKRWPICEGSLTPTPCNPMAVVDFAAVTKHYKVASLPLPDALKATLDAAARDKLDSSDFAYIDGEGGKHLPIHDAAHVRAAIARFDQTHFEDDGAKRQAARKILAAAKRMAIEVSPDSAVAEAAGTKAAKALMEGSDSAGGFMANGDGDGDGDAGNGDSDDFARAAHTAPRSHRHSHADDRTHTHVHRHEAGAPTHDSSAHSHPIGMPDDHTEPADHEHAHGDGVTHQHAHTHAAGEPAHDTAVHGHPVGAMKAFWVKADLSYEALRDALQDLLNPTGPFAGGCSTYLVATYPGYAIACRSNYSGGGDDYGGDGDGDGDDQTYWRIDYSVGEDGRPKIDQTTQVEQSYVPVAPMKAAGPLTLDAQDAERRASVLQQRTKGLLERRIKEGRVLSASNVATLGRVTDQLDGAVKALRDLLAVSDRTGREQAKAAALASPEALLRDLDLLRLSLDAYPAA